MQVRAAAAEGTGWQGHFTPPATSRRKLCTMNSMSSSSLISLKLLSTVTRPCCITLMRSQISKR